MTRYSFGDVLLIRFPFSDSSNGSKRPAVVLYDSADLDILLCRVTTQAHFSAADFSVSDWKRVGLLRKSYVRIGKMATLEKGMIQRKLGSLLPFDVAEAKRILKEIFEL